MSRDPLHTVELRVDGDVYDGWKSGELTQGMDQLASTFSLEYWDAWGEEPWPIEEGAECELRIDGEPILDGYVDDAVSEYSSTDSTLNVDGRSKLGDLVDCSSVKKGSQWLQSKGGAIVNDLVSPFGISTSVPTDIGQFRRFKFEPGETVAETITRLAKLRGYVLTDDVGTLKLERAGSGDVADTLRRGDNILRGRRRGSWRDRYSEYRFKGQTQASDEVNGKSASQLKGKVTDTQVDRHRPLVVVAGGPEGDSDLGKRALLERNRRAGRSERLTYAIEGFRTQRGSGEIWKPNTLVKVDDPALRVDATLLVVAVRMRFGPDEPMVTTLELTRPEAFDQVDYPARGRGELWQ